MVVDKKYIKYWGEIKKLYPVVYENLLIDLHITKGNDKFTKFIIIGRSRTGSNFLRGMLNSHPQIYCYGEKYRDFDRSKKINPIEYLTKNIFRKYSNTIKAVGFKLFYYHSRSEENVALWKYIKENKDIKIIHITRENMLETFVSRLKAGVTDKWSNQSGVKEQTEQFEIKYEDALKEFEWTENWQNTIREYLITSQVYELVYEDLSKNSENEMKRILKFLDIKEMKLRPSTYKQAKNTLNQSISNYSELKNKFKGSKWEVFFEE